MNDDSFEAVSLDPAERRVGTVVGGKWKLERLLGVGGMAAVYAATHRNGARAAIKLFPFGVTTSPDLAERFLREGYLANRIGHEAVVRVLDDHVDHAREHAYLVMELLEGETARQRVERTGPLSPREAIELVAVLCDCLSSAHDRGVIHRDIKPENLFITTEGELKVLDFGVARALDTQASLTKSGATLGTPAYMSPEQARGKHSELSPASDLYSVGATLLFLLSGRILHDGESAQEIMVRAAWTPPLPAKTRCPELPDSIAAIIDTACAFDPKDRYPHASALRAALLKAAADLEGDPRAEQPLPRPAEEPTDETPRPPPAATIVRTPPKSKIWPWLLAAIVTTTAIVIAARSGLDPGTDPRPASQGPLAPESRIPSDSPGVPLPAESSIKVPPPAPAASAAPGESERTEASAEPSSAPRVAPAPPVSAKRAPRSPAAAVSRSPAPAAPPPEARSRSALGEENGAVKTAPIPTGRDVGY